MKLRTELKIYEQHNIIDYQSKVLLIGSCFAEHLQRFLKLRKYQSFLNPCGISYNPTSIAKNIQTLLDPSKFDKKQIRENEGRYFHFDYHGQFAHSSMEGVKANILNHLELGHSYAVPDVLIISLGTAFAYQLKQNKEVVNNCHKVPQSEFKKIFLSPAEVVNTIGDAINQLLAKNPLLKIVLTVSPIRHIKDGMIENNRSKASLLLACAELEEAFENLYYFPSYELLLDDLRDYRFYQTDLVHPSKVAIDYILDAFNHSFMNVEEKEIRTQVLSIQKRIQHRAFLAESNAHQEFLKKLIRDIKSLELNSDLILTREMQQVQKSIVE